MGDADLSVENMQYATIRQGLFLTPVDDAENLRDFIAKAASISVPATKESLADFTQKNIRQNLNGMIVSALILVVFVLLKWYWLALIASAFLLGYGSLFLTVWIDKKFFQKDGR
jgi:hypothetical protein